jgi:hypothetical protein
MELSCPSCSQTDRVEKVTGVHARGIRESTSNQTGIGMSLDDPEDQFVFVAGSETIHSSLLSRRLAPPAEPGWFGAIVFTLVLFWIVGSIFSSITPDWPAAAHIAVLVLVGGLLLVIVVRGLTGAQGEFSRNYAVWSSQYYCYRCDRVFSAN